MIGLQKLNTIHVHIYSQTIFISHPLRLNIGIDDENIPFSHLIQDLGDSLYRLDTWKVIGGIIQYEGGWEKSGSQNNPL